MRVLHIVQSVAQTNGGIARAVHGLVEALEAKGLAVALVSCTAEEKPLNENVSHFFSPHKNEPNLRSYLSRVISEFQPDLIHTHGIWLPSIHHAASLARQRGISYIMSLHGMLDPWPLAQKKWKKRLALWLYQRRDLNRAAALHATANSEAENIRALGFNNPIICLPNGVTVLRGDTLGGEASLRRREEECEKSLFADAGSVAPQSIAPQSIAPQSIAPQSVAPQSIASRRTALFMSRMEARKGVVELVEAWARLRPQGWQCELVYTTANAEERAYEARVKARVEALGLVDQFVFTGPLDDEAKWDAYRRADFFVLPTYSENFGIVIAEALAAGLPAITTKGAPWGELEGKGYRVKGIGDRVKGVGYRVKGIGDSGRCGYWIEIGVEPLVDALREMMALSDDERAEMGARGHHLVTNKYTWPAIAEQMKKAYEKI